MWLLICAHFLCLGGCTHPDRAPAPVAGPSWPIVVVVAPVMNVGNSEAVDPLKFTDSLASEFLSFPNISVVPVNLVRAELARRGLSRVESPQQAVDLARTFHADAAVVGAITEYDPYDPPVLGLLLQWYAPPRRQTADPELLASSGDAFAPRVQAQRVFDASHREVQEELAEFGRRREGAQSPYAWRKFYHSQELYVRYCCWALIRSILSENAGPSGTPDAQESQR